MESRLATWWRKAVWYNSAPTGRIRFNRPNISCLISFIVCSFKTMFVGPKKKWRLALKNCILFLLSDLNNNKKMFENWQIRLNLQPWRSPSDTMSSNTISERNKKFDVSNSDCRTIWQGYIVWLCRTYKTRFSWNDNEEFTAPTLDRMWAVSSCRWTGRYARSPSGQVTLWTRTTRT